MTDISVSFWNIWMFCLPVAEDFFTEFAEPTSISHHKLHEFSAHLHNISLQFPITTRSTYYAEKYWILIINLKSCKDLCWQHQRPTAVLVIPLSQHYTATVIIVIHQHQTVKLYEKESSGHIPRKCSAHHWDFLIIKLQSFWQCPLPDDTTRISSAALISSFAVFVPHCSHNVTTKIS
jgi:hypothetical protein